MLEKFLDQDQEKIENLGQGRTSQSPDLLPTSHHQPFFIVQQNMLQLRIENRAILNTLIQLFSLMDRRVSKR